MPKHERRVSSIVETYTTSLIGKMTALLMSFVDHMYRVENRDINSYEGIRRCIHINMWTLPTIHVLMMSRSAPLQKRFKHSYLRTLWVHHYRNPWLYRVTEALGKAFDSSSELWYSTSNQAKPSLLSHFWPSCRCLWLDPMTKDSAPGLTANLEQTDDVSLTLWGFFRVRAWMVALLVCLKSSRSSSH